MTHHTPERARFLARLEKDLRFQSDEVRQDIADLAEKCYVPKRRKSPWPKND